VLATCPADPKSSEVNLAVEYRRFETGTSEHWLIARLAKHRPIAGKHVQGGAIEVVPVKMGDERRRDTACDLVRGDRKLDEGIRTRVRRLGHRRLRADWVEHRIDEQSNVPYLDEEGRVANEADAHLGFETSERSRGKVLGAVLDGLLA
jgi:ribosomal 50S subunit-recycling heat shock protein